MKKILIVLSAVSLLAVSCNKEKSSDTTETPVASGVAANATIVYFDLDSLVNKYDMYLDLRATFEAKAEKVNTELNTKGRALENGMRNYQDKVQKGLVTRAEAERLATRLESDQQSFLEFQQQSSTELAEEERVMLNNIHYSIVEYLKEYNKDGRYGMIISSSTVSGPVMNADPSFNITWELLEGLNRRYAADIKSGKIEAPAKPADATAEPAK